jgi:phosphoglycolate phosphatase-like HAD superfamily hydrolase
VRSLFAAIATGDDPSAIKPSPRPILEIAKQLGVEPSQLVMVGDGPQDIEAGRRAGCRTIGVLGGFLPEERLHAARPDVLVESLAELPQILSRWEDATVRAKTPSERV